MTSSWPAHHNWNIFASSLLIEVCARFGSSTFFVSPGYRDAPFIAALSLNPKVKLVSCWDERAAAYQALGYAKVTKKPSILICTSGTAGANYLPAIIEAKIDHIPLFVITADRPFESVFANAQQVIDQRDIFGKFVKKSLDFPAPSPSLNPRAWISYARMLLQTATEDRPGPVHMNLPFHAPLDPIENSEKPSAELIEESLAALERMSFDDGAKRVSKWSWDLAIDLAADVCEAKRGLLLIGRLPDDEAERKQVRAFRDLLGWPVYADIGSGLKFEYPKEIPDPTIPAARKALDEYRADCVVHIGKRLVSRHFDDAISRLSDLKYWILSDEELVQDPYHIAERRQHRADWPEIFKALEDFETNESLPQISCLNRRLSEVKSPSFNFRDVAQVIQDGAVESVFLGNSTAIRAFDSWCFSKGGELNFQANRGVSGIEGLLATTIGLSLASKGLWTLVVGDISLLHDLNSVIALAQSEAKVIVVLVNNVGGRIFETLPVQKYAWVKDPLISTPHDFEFSGIATMARIPYDLCRTKAEFENIYAMRAAEGISCMIECAQDAEADLNFIRALAAQEDI